MTTRGAISILLASTPAPSKAGRRIFDINCAILGAVAISPVILIVIIVIWLETGRPIFFAQLRIGQGGKPFWIYKFRKFRPDCDSNGCPVTVEDDDRLTLVGRVLEFSKLDELPQLWNVLRGDMAIVGPRPESLAFIECFRDGFERVLEHRPGLFGPSQVLFRHECRLYPADARPEDFYRQVLFPAKARIDLEYFQRRTFLSDLGWILRAALAIIVGISNKKIPHSRIKRSQHMR